MMHSFEIELRPDEQALADQIEFDALKLRGHENFSRNSDLAVALAQKLLQGGRVPEHRRLYFIDPEYNIGGRGASKQQVFERNGCCGLHILRHPHFLPYLRYFIFGADLPEPVRDSFKSKVEDCGLVTSSDIIPLGDHAKVLTQRYGLLAHEASDEFFKLALDCGLDPGTAKVVRNTVRKIR